jgi:HTH-type transcriptional regulator/antitoxin HipB
MHKGTSKADDGGSELAKVHISALRVGLGTQLEQRRNALELTQQQVADLAGVSRRSIIAVEGGDPTSLNTLLSVLDVLGLQITLQTGRSE